MAEKNVNAAPVAQLLYDTMPDMIIAVLIDNEIDPLKYAEKWAEAIGPLYAHPETIEQVAKILCRGYSHTLRGLRSPAKVADDLPCNRCLAWAVAVRDALNTARVDRLKGEGETNG